MAARGKQLTALACGAAIIAGGVVTASVNAHAESAGAGNAATISAGAFATQNNQITSPGYYLLPYSPDIWYYAGAGSPYHVTFDQWRAAGFPTPKPAATTYGQVPGHADIWAQTEFGTTSNSWVVSVLTFNAWAKAGYPKPTISDPTPAFARNVVQWQGSSEVFYASAVTTGGWEKLTYAAWVNYGSPTPLYQLDQGIGKLPWSDVVSRVTSWSSGAARTLTFAQWVELGLPTPTTVSGYVGQRFCTRGGNDVYYYGGGIQGMKLSFAQWVAAGGPRPTAC